MKIICVSGSVAVGKTTFIEKILIPNFNNCEYIKENIKEWILSGEFAKFQKDPINNAYNFELMTLNDRNKTINQYYETIDKNTEIIIMERDLLSSKIFFDISKKMGFIDKYQESIYEILYQEYLNTTKMLPDIYIYLCPHIDVIMRQIGRAHV